MALPKNQKRYEVQLPVCKYCGAVGRHYSYQCPNNPDNACKYCGSPYHKSIQCFEKPRKPIRKESIVSLSKRTQTSREWFKQNPPDERGRWFCYLRISPDCPHVLTRSTIQLEHVRSKVRRPDLKYDIDNLKPSCHSCNRQKASRSVEDLTELFPHLTIYL